MRAVARSPDCARSVTPPACGKTSQGPRLQPSEGCAKPSESGPMRRTPALRAASETAACQGRVACVQIVRDRDEGEADAFLGQFRDDRRHALRGNGQEGQVHAPGNLLDVGVAGGLSQALVFGVDGVQLPYAGALQGVPKLHAVALRLQTRSYQGDGARMKGKVKSLWRHGKKRERAVFLTVFYRRRFRGKEIPEGRGPFGIETESESVIDRRCRAPSWVRCANGCGVRAAAFLRPGPGPA